MTYIKINYWKGSACCGKLVEKDNLEATLESLVAEGAKIHHIGEIQG
jgi:hypothetical protein